jgi:hypothetical protein
LYFGVICFQQRLGDFAFVPILMQLFLFLNALFVKNGDYLKKVIREMIILCTVIFVGSRYVPIRYQRFSVPKLN